MEQNPKPNVPALAQEDSTTNLQQKAVKNAKPQKPNKAGKGAQQAKQFIEKEHHDSNMVVAVRVRPLNQKEKQN